MHTSSRSAPHPPATWPTPSGQAHLASAQPTIPEHTARSEERRTIPCDSPPRVAGWHAARGLAPRILAGPVSPIGGSPTAIPLETHASGSSRRAGYSTRASPDRQRQLSSWRMRHLDQIEAAEQRCGSAERLSQNPFQRQISCRTAGFRARRRGLSCVPQSRTGWPK
jgi:hypothetical protein